MRRYVDITGSRTVIIDDYEEGAVSQFSANKEEKCRDCFSVRLGSTAVSFPQSFGGYTTGDKCLLIEQQNKTICYLIEQDKISRIEIDKEKEKVTWQIPNGQIEWQVWQKNGAGLAVEIRKYVKLKDYDLVEKKMENAYVYFIGVSQEVVN